MAQHSVGMTSDTKWEDSNQKVEVFFFLTTIYTNVCQCTLHLTLNNTSILSIVGVSVFQRREVSLTFMGPVSHQVMGKLAGNIGGETTLSIP